MIRSRLPSRRRAGGFSLVEVLIGATVIAIAGMAGVAYVARASQNADYTRDRIFARQKGLSIVSELRGYVEGGAGEVAADLDGFDDGVLQQATLSIAPDPAIPGNLVAPNHKLSGNVMDQGEWRWYRRITVQRFPGVVTRDLRICTVRVYRHRPGGVLPGEMMADVSTVVRTIGDAYPTAQVYDIYLLALENVPGWWVYMDTIKPFIDATVQDLESRNPGLTFRTHWITTSGYGRDPEYAPYTNETRSSTDDTPWAYVYPGTMPAGSASSRYYIPEGMRARMNLDGVAAPTFRNGYTPSEPYTDANANGRYDKNEPFSDSNGDGYWNVQNPNPYAIADQHNHAMRAPDEQALFAARVAAGQDTDDTPTWRLLLDRMIADPAKYHNAIFINLHGELLPMPAVRNYSDAAKNPIGKPGWRAVTHPERLRPRRVTGNNALTDRPRWRVYAYKAEFPSPETLTTQREPYTDVNKNGACDGAEPFQDWNGDGRWTDETPIAVSLPGFDVSSAPNAAVNPTLLVNVLAGGIDADGNGAADPYQAFALAKTYPEAWVDGDGDGRVDVVEAYFDRNGSGTFNAGEPYTDVDGDGKRDAVADAFTDGDGNGRPDVTKQPADVFTDSNANARWDAAEPFLDLNGNGVCDPPAAPILPWLPWNPAVNDQNGPARAAYTAAYGEPWTDVNLNGSWTPAEPLLYDVNGNGRWDGGFSRGRPWFEVSYDAVRKVSRVILHATPLETPETADGRGLDAGMRLYDLDYIPCPTPAAANAANPPFERDLFTNTVDVPKNTARWTIELPLPVIRSQKETVVGSGNGDATDLILEIRTRIGSDPTTGTMFPVRNSPQNLSRAHCYFHANTSSVPFSERYQFQGDPRHSPYADTNQFGTAFVNGYNWWFDSFTTSGDARSLWPAFDAARLRDGWKGRIQYDGPRLWQWLRQALTKTEAVYTTLTGFSYFYLSIGGDVGYDSANGFASSIPMDGAPFGSAADVYEDTIAGGGTVGIGGSQKHVRNNGGILANGIRTGGAWWSKPWLGELFEDATYAGQWAAWGNLRAATGTSASQYRLVRRGDVPTAQMPFGTRISNKSARTAEEGSTSLFNVGTAASTFHHQYADGATGNLVGDGNQLAANYNFPLPTAAPISRPFGLATALAGGVGDEYAYATDYPRYTASTVVDFYDHLSGNKGSALIRLVEPGASPKAGFVVVNGIDRTTGSGSAFIARYSLITLVHSFLAAGLPGTGRIKQLPRLQLLSPTIVTELTNPVSVPVIWKTEWKRWDGKPYTTGYAVGFTELESDLVYLVLYSKDGGQTWLNVKTNQPETPGVLPWIAGVGPDPARTKSDAATGNETYVWPTPVASFPEGTYMLRVEGYRRNEALHYVSHQEKIYVNR